MTTTVDLLDALCAHLAQFELPTICSVHAAASIPAPQLTVQLASHEPHQIASTLLAWADTLTEITVQTWRVPHGTSVHLSVTGRLSSNATVCVYGDMPVTNHGIGADLTPDAARTIPLTVLRNLATLGGSAA